MPSIVVVTLAAARSPQTATIQHAKRFYGHIRCLSASQRQRTKRCTPGRLLVQANELNHWADRSNYDSHDEESWEFAQFDRELAFTLLRVLTAKAAQRLLLQLQELDVFKAQWFNNYLSEHPPTDGNKFLLELFRAPSTVVHDASTKTDHKIEPANLANRIIEIRADMGRTLLHMPKFIEQENTEVQRQHLTTSTYLSGSSGEQYRTRRGYYRRR